MKIISDPKKINRNSKIGLYTSLASLIFLFAAVGLTLFGFNNTSYTSYSFGAMVVGLLLSQVGVYYANRWGKSPRVDERITQGLKGLDDRYTLYHYVTPVPHLLAGPAGVWVLTPEYQAGSITYANNRFRQNGVGLFSRIIGQEGLGRPEMEAKGYQEEIEKYLRKSLGDAPLPDVQPAIVFTSPKASVQTPDAPIPTMHVDKLKDFIRRMAKETPANMDKIRQVQQALPEKDLS